MAQYEYKVIPAPTKGEKAAGIKAPEARMASTVQALLNAQAAAGWEYMRTDTLPSNERRGLTSTQTVHHSLMFFRRQRAELDNADRAILSARSIAESVTPDRGPPGRREPSLTPIQPSRADPASPNAPDKPEPPAPGSAKGSR